MGFVQIVNEAVRGKTMNDAIPSSPVIDKLLKLLDTLNSWADEIPPIDQPQRFGNQAFRTWWERLRDVCKEQFTIVLIIRICFNISLECYNPD